MRKIFFNVPLGILNEPFNKRSKCLCFPPSSLKSSKHRYHKEIWGRERKFVLPLSLSLCVYMCLKAVYLLIRLV